MGSPVLGCDPGLGGALALLNGDGALVSLWDMPLKQYSDTPAGRNKRRVDGGRLGLIMRHARRVCPQVMLALELVQPMPSTGGGEDDERVPMPARSAFTFGESVAAVWAVAEAFDVRVRWVAPVAWKRAVGLAAGAGKAAALERAAGFFPAQAHLLKRKTVDTGRADALLIAWAEWQNTHGSPF